MTITLPDTGSPSLHLVESYAAGTDAAGTDRIYAREGQRVSRRRRSDDPTYQRRLLEMQHLYEDVVSGDRRAALEFRESMSRSDFAFLFGDVIDRQMLAAYATQPVQWDAVARRGRVRDFRTVRRFTLDGGQAVLNQVKELEPYKARAVTDGKYEYAVAKYGAEIDVSWETLINDDLGALADLPSLLGTAARRTEERFATALYAGTSGPNGTFFSSGNKNIISAATAGTGAPTNPPLSITALQYAFTVLASQLDADGGPIYVEAVTLVVPPALTVPANNIVNATQVLAAAGSGGVASDAGRPDLLQVANWMAQRVRVVTNPWLPIISSTANGSTSWYLFADPGVGRPAAEVGFLSGHEAPELWMKAPDAMRVGGGMVGAEEGDFATDGIRYRVRHVVGGTLMDPKSAVGSNGTNA